MLVAQESIRLRVAAEFQSRRAEREIVFEDRRDVTACSVEIKTKEKSFVALIERDAQQMARNDILLSQTYARDKTVAVRERVGRSKVCPAKRRGLEIRLDPTRQTARTVEVSTVQSQAERVQK